MFYCFNYPDSTDKILSKYFDKSLEEDTVEIYKYNIEEDFYVCKSTDFHMYLANGTKLKVQGDLLNILDNRNLVKGFEVKLYKFWIGLAKTCKEVEVYDQTLDFHLGKIFSNTGKRLGDFLIYKDLRTKKILLDIFKKKEIAEIESSDDLYFDMISLLTKLEKF